MYWDGDKKTYIPAATEQVNAEGAPSSVVDPDSPFAAPGKEKKDKPKNKTAQQVSAKVLFFLLLEIMQMFTWRTATHLHYLSSVSLLHYNYFTNTIIFINRLPKTWSAGQRV